MTQKCDIYCQHDYHPFIHQLSINEKKYIQETAYSNIYLNTDLPKNHKELELLSKNLKLHFETNPTKHYFLKLNKLSPKDAYYIMCDDDNSENDTKTTINDIKRDLDILHVGKPLNRLEDYCINILLNSDRVYCELAFSDIDENISVLLLDYKQINHKTETRIYVKDKKIIGISQYYCDLSDVYDTLINLNNSQINEFIKTQIIDVDSYVCDIYIDNDNNFQLIELNQFAHSTDSCLFTWDELDAEPFEFRYKENNDIKSISLL
jgi:hypothetical protein